MSREIMIISSTVRQYLAQTAATKRTIPTIAALSCG
jgi:hypothetical protein